MAEWSRILPLIIVLVFVAILAFVGFVVYSIVMDVKKQTKKRMEKKNVNMSKTGMKVGVKEIEDEEYRDKTQSVLVNIWDAASIPNKSSLFGGSKDVNKRK